MVVVGATCMPSVTLADMYEEKDGQKFNWNNYIPGYNESDAVKKKAFQATLNSTKQKLEAIPDTTLLGEIYRGRDPRMMQSLIVPYSYYNGYIVGTGAKKAIVCDCGRYYGGNGFIQNDRGWNVYFYRKFVPIEDMGGAITNRNHTPINFPIIRFADVLLMLAEAYNEDNQLDKAVAELNKVRKKTVNEYAGIK
ncbi:RagB/SusD family nutrient uptake outer membrane protein [Bacteroides ovatus]|nr:RagB/SusD family nutrient uptake outer membrane protein [Bacteroides ovatus]